ncbi:MULTISPECIES: NAD(+) kinase [unclassified Methylophaga]|uniref:NAD(+) kinase n=1 Tax=unclassified Methylophaga TaxID=2629249 RepID=UPI0025E30D14|nr:MULTISPECIES: NAD(+) kinase [unclassified Methylophaga]|tara:strand:+ start:20581 stop:21453 length:873 start_codon:yes stop_codon:yes gene_type:complete
MMNNTFKRIGLFIRKDDPVLESAVIQVSEFLHSRALKVLSNEPMSFLPGLEVISIADFPSKCDLTIAIGGDGTMLSASRALAGFDLPIVGINVGRLGFLADVTLNNLQSQLTRILDGHYRHDSRFLLQAHLNNAEQPICIAMNDVVVHSHQSLHMIEFETHINGRFLNSQRADGLVIATPTGSTAYAMSAGGPILDVDLDAMVLTSVCPHTLSNRPLVIAASSVIDITLSEKNITTAMVTCDGRPGHLLEPGDSIRIQRHPNRIDLLHLEDHDHYSILRAKLEWGRKLTC